VNLLDPRNGRTGLTRLDRYLIGKYWLTYALFFGLIMAIAVVFDVSQKLDDFITGGVPFTEVVTDYYVHFVAYYGTLFSALIVFLSTVFFTSRLSAQTELVAMLVGGMSYPRLLRPYTLAAGAVCLLLLLLQHWWIPASNAKRIAFEDRYVLDVPVRDERPINIHRQIRPGLFLYLETWSPDRLAGYHLTLETIEEGKLQQKLSADFARYDTAKKSWFLDLWSLRTLHADGERLVTGRALDTVLPFGPDRVLPRTAELSTLNSWDLWQFLQAEAVSGSPTVKRLALEFHRRTAYPFSVFILTALAVALASPKKRGGLGNNIALGLGLAVLYLFIIQLTGLLVTSLAFPPALAIWTPNLLFTGGAVWLTQKSPK
jgi:lipopolysaccharide export system permease protein